MFIVQNIDIERNLQNDPFFCQISKKEARLCAVVYRNRRETIRGRFGGQKHVFFARKQRQWIFDSILSKSMKSNKIFIKSKKMLEKRKIIENDDNFMIFLLLVVRLKPMLFDDDFIKKQRFLRFFDYFMK